MLALVVIGGCIYLDSLLPIITGYGAFFWLNRGGRCPDVPADMFSCNGHDGQQIYIIPSKELVVVILGYSPKPDRVIDFNALLRDLIAQL